MRCSGCKSLARDGAEQLRLEGRMNLSSCDEQSLRCVGRGHGGCEGGGVLSGNRARMSARQRHSKNSQRNQISHAVIFLI